MDYIKDIIVWDMETPRGCFLNSFYVVEEDRYIDFLINQYQNDLYKMIKWLETKTDKYFVGFNNINFDGQILQYILDNYHSWFDKTNLEISTLISEFGGKCIEDQNYNLFLPYKEEHMEFKQLDVPRVLHWFNENKRVGLKQAEFELRAETIENFDIDVNKEHFTKKEVEDLTFYCHNDVKYTYEIFKHIIGGVEHPLYKGKDKIFDREVVEQEVGLRCLNWDDVKIGAEWNKMDYINDTGADEKKLKPTKVNHFFGKKYKKFFPPTVEFQTKQIQDFIHSVGETFVLNEKQDFILKINDKLTIQIGKGGIHSQELPRYLKPEEWEIFLQNDIGSQYPNAINKYGIHPLHLKKDWNLAIPKKINRRIANKKLYKETKEPKYNSLQEMGKLQLNGGLYGRLNTPGDWQQDPCAMLMTTLGCQLEILMIVEALILKDFNITSCNTDGWDCMIPRERLNEYFDIVAYYEEKIGNKEMGNVEFTEFGWMAQTSVNDYVAEKVGVWENREFKEDRIAQKGSKYPHLKTKGDFAIDFLLEKNSSFRIVPLALVEYFDNGTDVEEFINTHNDIFDFCARSNGGLTYEHQGFSNNKSFPLPKLIRYYVAKEGIHIKKMVKEHIDTNANDQNVKPAENLKKICNYLPKEIHNEHLMNVDRKWYIDKVLEGIRKVELGKKNVKKVKVDKSQISMF